MKQNKKVYQAPKVTVHGDASQLTQLTKQGDFLDATFPTGTPLSQVTTKLS